LNRTRKCASNLRKHGFDLADAVLVPEGDRLVLPAHPGTDEARLLATGRIGPDCVTPVYTEREDAIRVISMMSAQHGERQQHQALFGRWAARHARGGARTRHRRRPRLEGRARRLARTCPAGHPRQPKKLLSLRIDEDIVEFFRSHGPDYQTWMNAVLRAYVMARRKQEQAGQPPPPPSAA
jgi:uncharacterized protein (DUF4415 family)